MIRFEHGRFDKQKHLKALHRIIAQADFVLGTINDSHPSINHSRELVKAAAALSKDLADPPEAVFLGAIGGKKTAEPGPEYYSKIAKCAKEGGWSAKAESRYNAEISLALQWKICRPSERK